MKIEKHYKTQIDSKGAEWMITPCKFLGDGTRIASTNCKMCEFFIEDIKDNKVVLCNAEK